MTVDGWRLAVDGWRLVVGGWRSVVAIRSAGGKATYHGALLIARLVAEARPARALRRRVPQVLRGGLGVVAQLLTARDGVFDEGEGEGV